MQLNDFDYELPGELIAQEPAPERAGSLMLVVQRSNGALLDTDFSNFPDSLRQGDLLVINNTRVFPARLAGTSDTGASIEIFLLEQLTQTAWRALARPARRLKVGKRVSFSKGLSGSVVEVENGGRIRFEFRFEGNFEKLLDEVGQTPLPPYIVRARHQPLDADRDRYQTIYAKHRGAIAAPTAGLHFTDRVFDSIRSRGVEIVEITLHVGYGTFEPVREVDLSRHTVMPERYEIGVDAANALNRARGEGRRIVAVGTTTTRALETALAVSDKFVASGGLADLTVTPGYRFRAVSALLTNFHLPKSSLLILVSTFGGHELIMNAYRHAVSSRYRFYSYGDCMFIE